MCRVTVISATTYYFREGRCIVGMGGIAFQSACLLPGMWQRKHVRGPWGREDAACCRNQQDSCAPRLPRRLRILLLTPSGESRYELCKSRYE